MKSKEALSNKAKYYDENTTAYLFSYSPYTELLRFKSVNIMLSYCVYFSITAMISLQINTRVWFDLYDEK